ncbi:MAG: hypothetical protein M3297_07805 [Thermoproteota archaeon]|nr:hypothetical protein [Thermoproteota archaeon]
MLDAPLRSNTSSTHLNNVRENSSYFPMHIVVPAAPETFESMKRITGKIFSNNVNDLYDD